MNEDRTKEDIYDSFINLMESSGWENIVKDKTMQDNLMYLIDRYYNTSYWIYMKDDIIRMIKDKDIMGLVSYIFKAVQRYRKLILKVL